MPIRTVVVDDEPLARDELIYLLSQQEGIEVVGEAGDAEEALRLICKSRPHVVFLDIDLGGESGLELARRLLESVQPLRVIFATAYDQYAVQAFELKALDYILKPFTEARVAEAVARLKEMVTMAPPPPGWQAGRDRDASAPPTDGHASPPPAERRANGGSAPGAPGRLPDRIAVEENERIILLPPESILYATREERVTLIKAEGGTYRTNLSLQELEERLAEHPFFRPHRAYLVNVERIAEIHPWFNGAYELVMMDPERSRIPVSRGSAKRLRELLRF